MFVVHDNNERVMHETEIQLINGKRPLQNFNKVDTTNRCEAFKEVMSLNYVSY